MNPAVVVKTFRDSVLTLLMGMLGIILFAMLFVWAMKNFGNEVLEFIGKLPFLTKVFEISFGIQTSGTVSINVLLAVGFTHAVVLALAWGVLIATFSRALVGEIERGTADVLLTLPISRTVIYCSISLAGLAIAVLVSICPWIGVWLGSCFVVFDEPVRLVSYLPVTLDFLAINLAIAGATCLVSSISNRRGPAIGVVVGVAVVSATLNFLEPFLSFLHEFRFLSLLHYYRPPDIVRTGEFPLVQIAALTAMAVACWLGGLIVYSRKDIPVA